MEAEEREDGTEFEELFPELMKAIFGCLQLKPLVRLKSVCKIWSTIVADLRHSRPPTTDSGLLLYLQNQELRRSCFVQVRHPDRTHQNCGTLHSSTTHSFPWLIDSCNGLLLYAKTDDKNLWNYFVSSPLLDQLIPLPLRHNPSMAGRESLAFEPSSTHPQFKIVCYFKDEFDVSKGEIACQIFWSGTWEWRETKAQLKNSYLLLEDGFEIGHCFGSSVYTHGRLYWIWSLCMMVFDLNCEFFNLVQLPRSSGNTNIINNGLYFLAKFLYESEGNIHYCEPTPTGFCIWVLSEEELSWRATRNVVSNELKSRLVRPFAFNDDLQVLYLVHLLHGKVVSYSFETGEAGDVWYFDKPGKGCLVSSAHSFLFKPVYLNSYMSMMSK